MRKPRPIRIKVPSPEEIRLRLAVLMTESALLRKLLVMSVRIHREQDRIDRMLGEVAREDSHEP